MFKWLFLAVLATILVLGIFFAGSFHLVRTKDGFHFIRKQEFGFEELVLDTREWTPVDWLKHPQLSLEMASKKLNNWGNRAKDRWSEVSAKLDDLVSEIDLEESSQQAEAKLKEVRDTVREKYERLVKRFNEGDISLEKFEAMLEDLEQWSRREFEKIKRKFG